MSTVDWEIENFRRLCACVHLRNQFDNLTIHNTSYYYFTFSLILLLFIYSFVVVVIVTTATIVDAACLCMLENNANVCTHYDCYYYYHQHNRASERQRERESKPISNNIKHQVRDREGKRERELLSIAKRNEEKDKWTNIGIYIHWDVNVKSEKSG